MRIQFNPQALAAYGLNIDDVRTTIGNFNVNTPKGNFDGPAQATTINANDQIESAAQYANTVIAYRNGDPVRLSDVANVVSGAGEHQARRLGEHHAGDHPQRAAPAGRQRHRGGRPHQGAAAADRHPRCPSAVDVGVLSDRTVTIRASVADVEFELALAVVLVVLVIFLFLRTLPAPSFRACRCRCRWSARSA